MPRNHLRDVDVIAISIVDKGANRKRFYLRKQQEDENLLTLPSPHRLLKKQNWSTVYCVVAEPGWAESPGQGAAQQDIEDVWADEDEIRKAAHKFMKNGALVNRMHESLEPYGTLVENFIAQADFDVQGETILKGSWVIGIHPSEEGMAKIEAGEFTGISIQGTGIRELAKAKGSEGPKAKKCPKCSGTVSADKKTCQNCGYSFSVKKLDIDAIEKVSSKAYPSLQRAPGKRDNWIEAVGGLPKFIEAIAKHLHYEQGMSISRAIATAISRCKVWAAGGDGVKPDTQAKAAKAIAEWEAKKGRSKGSKLRKLQEIEEGVDPDAAKVRDEAMNDETPVTMGWLRKAFGLGASAEPESTEEEVVSEVATDTISKAEFDALAENVEKSTKSVETLAARIADIAQALAEGKKAEEEAPKVPTAEEVYHRLAQAEETITKSLDEIRADVEQLAKGDSVQREAATITKQNEHPLAGILD